MADFVRLCKVSEIPDPGKETFEIDDRFVVVCHVDGGFYALDDRCTHDGGPLGEGMLEGFRLGCPRHGAQFDIQTGAALTMPAVHGTTTHEVKVEDGFVLLKLSD
jgi:3-phenylpropionate/trans-cinnamate dioxygenase ferredoxin subunit